MIHQDGALQDMMALQLQEYLADYVIQEVDEWNFAAQVTLGSAEDPHGHDVVVFPEEVDESPVIAAFAPDPEGSSFPVAADLDCKQYGEFVAAELDYRKPVALAAADLDCRHPQLAPAADFGCRQLEKQVVAATSAGVVDRVTVVNAETELDVEPSPEIAVAGLAVGVAAAQDG
ncbi:hypothetical protein E2562_026764 [Oryza meyeriana var. granulata]|uniref:Uncharacterized protein n=1 Tax=Oryza meyeriana var. granulata TaxID=110450 RepID=A0A6G1C9E4_9ORYZ|nr:hypothetical protein E2562_026764 [Oryza meyeriana var. granulata]